jgi:hypothetical protein
MEENNHMHWYDIYVEWFLQVSGGVVDYIFES